MKKIMIGSLVVMLLLGSYSLDVIGASEQAMGVVAATAIEKTLNYSQTTLNARQLDLVAIGKFTALDDQEDLRSTVLSTVENGNLTMSEVSVAIRQLYSSAGLRRTNTALATLEQIQQENVFVV